MFCSNCGKSILPEESSCRHCGASYGKERFYGNTYTSAQVRIPASKLNDAPVGGKVAYTRTDYFEQQPADDIYSNTSYRPLLRQEDDLTRIEAERAEQEAEEEARLQAEEDARRAEEELREQERREAQQAQDVQDIQDIPDGTEVLSEEDWNDAQPAAEIENAEDAYAEDAYAEDAYAEDAYAEDASTEGYEEYKEEYKEEYEEYEEYSEDVSENASEDIPEDDVPQDAPLPDDLEDAVISQTVLAHMERQRLDDERRANNSLRMAPLMNLTRKFTPSFRQGGNAQAGQGEANIDVEQNTEARASRNLFGGIFGRKSAPADGDTAEEVQVEYAQDAEYAEEAYSEETYSEEAYSDDAYSEEDYDGTQTDDTDYDAAYDTQENSDTDYAEDDFSDAQSQDEYTDADYADADYADAEYDENIAQEADAYDAFEDTAASESKFKLDLSALMNRLNLNVNIKELIKSRALTIAVAAVLIVAVIIGGVVWLNFITEQRPKIVNVTYETYQQGIQMLTANVSDEYRSEMKQVYISNTSFANTSFDEDMQAFNALLPASPMTNDPLFITTLTIIQDAIEDAIKEDAKAEMNGTAAEYADTSELKWQAIKNAIDKLSKATTPGELSVIASDLELVVAPTPSPSPSPTPEATYPTLSNGTMDSAEVKMLQDRLITLGYLTGTADGDFGNGTEAAVKAFQRAAGLTVDGIATHEVQKALYADDAPRTGTSATSAPSDPSSQS